MTYSEKLKDPRWQRKRLEVLQRDDFMCRWCGDNESTLHVHHLSYSADPWETPEGQLLTLCENCHEADHVERQRAEKALLKSIREKGFNYGHVYSIAAGFNYMKPFHNYDVMSSVIDWLLQNEELLKNITEQYFENLKSKDKDISNDDLSLDF